MRRRERVWEKGRELNRKRGNGERKRNNSLTMSMNKSSLAEAIRLLS